MQVLKQILIVLLLVFWLPAANHCILEMASVIAADECGTTQTAAPVSSDPCDTGCKLIEKAAYKSEFQKTNAAIPLLVLLFENTLDQQISTASTEVYFWPPETLHLPQFVMSTALPARAPSFVS